MHPLSVAASRHCACIPNPTTTPRCSTRLNSCRLLDSGRALELETPRRWHVVCESGRLVWAAGRICLASDDGRLSGWVLAFWFSGSEDGLGVCLWMDFGVDLAWIGRGLGVDFGVDLAWIAWMELAWMRGKGWKMRMTSPTLGGRMGGCANWEAMRGCETYFELQMTDCRAFQAVWIVSFN